MLLLIVSQDIQTYMEESCGEHWCVQVRVNINPLSPNIHKQILQTDLYTFPSRISWENLIKDQGIFP